MNTFNNVIEEVTITDLPVKKWFNLTIRVRHDKMDTISMALLLIVMNLTLL